MYGERGRGVKHDQKYCGKEQARHGSWNCGGNGNGRGEGGTGTKRYRGSGVHYGKWHCGKE